MSKKMFVVLAFGLAACAGQPKSPLPAGSYHYQTTGGVTVDSTVGVSYQSGEIVLQEDTHYGEATETANYRLDPKSYSVVSFTSTDGDNGAVSVSPAGAVNTRFGKTASVKPPLPGAPAFVDAATPGSYAMLPALVHATGATAINCYFPSTVHGKAFAISQKVMEATQERPDGVPSTDASLGLATPVAKTSSLAIWYDPSTYVVDAVKVGDALLIKRIP